MIATVTRWPCRGLVIASLGTIGCGLAGCDPSHIPDLGSSWLEEWKSVPLGAKQPATVIEGDSGIWWPRIHFPKDDYSNGSWAEMHFEECTQGGRCLLLQSRTHPSGVVQATYSQLTAQISIDLRVNTMFSATLDCTAVSRPDNTGIALGGIHIQLWPDRNGQFYTLAYLHEDSVTSGDYVAPVGFICNTKVIRVSGTFTRNLYNDFVAVYGDEDFGAWYFSRGERVRITDITAYCMTDITTIDNEVAECSCRVGSLELAER